MDNRQRITKFTGWFVGVLFLTALAAAPSSAAASATGSIGLRLLEAPLEARDDPRAQLYIVDHLAPGTTIHRRIEVSNSTSSGANIVLYSSAATIEKGSFLGAAGHTRNELSTWTSVSPGVMEVPAGGVSEGKVTIVVPPDAAPGEQYAVVWAEERSTPKGRSGITQVSRVGIRIYLSVGPGNPPAADFKIDSLTAARSDEGLPVVLASVHNVGGRALDMYGSLELLDGPSGLSAGPFPASLGTTLAIGDTGSVVIPLDKELPAGPWDARITLKSGLLERSAKARITFPDFGEAEPTITSSSGSGWLYLLFAGLVILIVLGITARFLWRRGRNRRRLARGIPVVTGS